MTTPSHEQEIEVLRHQLAESEQARGELAVALDRMLKHISPIEIEQHGGYSHAAQLVAANLKR